MNRIKLTILILAVALLAGGVAYFALRPVAVPFLDLGVSQVKGFERKSEKLPTMSVEGGKTVYCRMRVCDFRFPLPKGAQIQRADPVSGGFDTIKGAIYVTGPGGGRVDLSAYAELLRKAHFNVQPGFTSEADPPWVGTAAITNHPDGYTIPWAASGGDGGWVAVDIISNVTKIGFSYFGDY
jgi:hypothetical protein